MPNNTEVRFSEIPYVEKQRSRFDRSAEHKTTWNTGDLIPIEISEVLPGDTITADFSHVTRMTTPIAPVMDHAAMDVYAFFVPNRLLWNHWKAFCGENEVTHWEQPNSYTIPQITAPSGGWNVGSLMDYMGIPTGVGNLSVNHLPVRAYCKIVNDWFRDENLKDPCNIENGDSTVAGANKGAGYDYVTDIQKGAAPFKAAKWADYFTKALPEPQKGPDVYIPMGDTAPVKWGDDVGNLTAGNHLNDENAAFETIYSSNLNIKYGQPGRILTDGTWGNEDGSKYNSLYADISNATAVTINQLRNAFAIQRFYEAQARGGSRYIEFVQNVFGVNSPDARQQRSEYLGGKRFPINMDQVLQTSATGAVTPQGNTAAFSCTVNSDNLCTYSATEHGYFMVLGVIRTNHSYQQGIERFWSRKSFFDFYVPQLANIGEQEIRNKEIYAQGSTVINASTGVAYDEEVFGYQEAWADYRYHPNRISGKLRSTASGTLDIWHYGDKYNALPQLSSAWIDETEANVQRTLAVQSEPQFVSDFYIKSTWTRIMPLYSVPGLMDHH